MPELYLLRFPPLAPLAPLALVVVPRWGPPRLPIVMVPPLPELLFRPNCRCPAAGPVRR